MKIMTKTMTTNVIKTMTKTIKSTIFLPIIAVLFLLIGAFAMTAPTTAHEQILTHTHDTIAADDGSIRVSALSDELLGLPYSPPKIRSKNYYNTHNSAKMRDLPTDDQLLAPQSRAGRSGSV